MTTRLIGERVGRSEDRRILAGHGTFIDDIEPAGCLHVAMVRSTCANGRILGIEISAAAARDDVIAVYTAADLGELGRQSLPLLIPNPNLTEPRTQLPLAAADVHFVGEAVAMIVATSRAAAEDAAELVEVSYETRPAVVGPVVAFEGGDLVHADMTGNVAAHFVQEHGDVEAALAAAPRILQAQFWVERSAATPMECRGVVAIPDEFGHLLVYDTSQAPSTIRAGLSTYLNLAEHEVDVVAPDVGGGFGVKLPVFYPEEILVPWAALQLRRPVKFIEGRVEHFVASNHERAQWHEVQVGFDDDGRILALHDEFIHDAGAYCPYGIIIPIVTASRLPGPYKLPNYGSEMHVVYTNTVPVTPYRGAGMPQGAFVMERVVDLIARELGIDRAEVRRRNFIQPDEFPYVVGLIDEDGLTTTYDSGDYPAGLDKLLAAIGYDGFAAEQAAARGEGRRIGIGLGCYVEGTGSGPYEGARVHVEPTGKVFVTTGISTQGQAHATILAQVAAEILQVPFEDVVVRTGDTRRFKWATGTFASRIGVVASNAVAQAAQQVRDKAAEIAARILEANEADIVFEDGHVSVRGSPDVRVPLRQIAVLANPLRYAFSKEALAATQFVGDGGEAEAPPVSEVAPGLEATAYNSPRHATFASGAHAVVVEVDVETGEVRLLRYVIVHDCGRMINPAVVEGQVHGGTAQGIAGALYERMHYDGDGQLRNAGFADFLIPSAAELPEFRTEHVETLSPLNPLGVKGVGEAGCVPAAAAIMGAVSDAIGIEITETPLSPARLAELMQSSNS